MPNRRVRWRDRVFPWLTLIVAAFWVHSGRQWAPQMRESNSARLMCSLFVGGMGIGSSAADSNSGLLPSFGLLASASHSTATASGERKAPTVYANLHHSSKMVETTVYAWERMMYGVAGLLVVAALASWVTRRARMAHLVAAVTMLLGTAATLAAMRWIEHPSGGNMPPLPIRQYLLAGSTLSAYAWVLLVAFARRTARPGVDEHPAPV
jgi:hypothetical protein